MINFLYEAHSGWRYLVLAVVVIAVLKLLIGWLSRANWSRFDQGLGAATPIVMDVQLLLGLVLYLLAPAAWFVGKNVSFGEHFGTMLVAIIVAHVAWSRVKKNTDSAAKFQIGAVGFAVAGLLVGVGVARITGWM